jgi:hypothetical protein
MRSVVARRRNGRNDRGKEGSPDRIVGYQGSIVQVM